MLSSVKLLDSIILIRRTQSTDLQNQSQENTEQTVTLEKLQQYLPDNLGLYLIEVRYSEFIYFPFVILVR